MFCLYILSRLSCPAFTDSEGDGIESRQPFQIFSTLPGVKMHLIIWFKFFFQALFCSFDVCCPQSSLVATSYRVHCPRFFPLLLFLTNMIFTTIYLLFLLFFLNKDSRNVRFFFEMKKNPIICKKWKQPDTFQLDLIWIRNLSNLRSEDIWSKKILVPWTAQETISNFFSSDLQLFFKICI